MHSEMHAVWQNPIQRTVRRAHLSVLMIVYNCRIQYNTEHSDNLPSYLQTKTFRFRTREWRVKTVNFDVGNNLPKLIGYHSNVPWTTERLVSFIIYIYASTDAETLVKTGSVVVEILGDIGQFWPSHSTIFIFYPTLTQKLHNRFSWFFHTMYSN